METRSAGPVGRQTTPRTPELLLRGLTYWVWVCQCEAARVDAVSTPCQALSG